MEGGQNLPHKLLHPFEVGCVIPPVAFISMRATTLTRMHSTHPLMSSTTLVFAGGLCALDLRHNTGYVEESRMRGIYI